MYGGSSVKSIGSGAAALIQGRGSDTFVGGARSTPTHTPLDIAKDTVVGGSATKLGGPAVVADALEKHGSHSLTLSNETINVAGTTAETVKGVHPLDSTTGHALTLSDKTTVTISGLSQHDISKLKH
jgi:hypothetical protein